MALGVRNRKILYRCAILLIAKKNLMMGVAMAVLVVVVA